MWYFQELTKFNEFDFSCPSEKKTALTQDFRILSPSQDLAKALTKSLNSHGKQKASQIWISEGSWQKWSINMKK